MEIHCSQIQYHKCCPSWMPRQSDNQQATEGTAVHSLLARYLGDEDVDAAKIVELYGLPVESISKVRGLYYSGKEMLEYLLQIMGENVGYECPFTCDIGVDTLAGTPDLWNIKDDTLFVADYKTGVNRETPMDQLFGYALLIRKQRGDAYKFSKFRFFTCWLTYQELETSPIYDESYLDEYEVRLCRLMNRKGFIPSDACIYCGNSTCTARDDTAKQAIKLLSDYTESLPLGKQIVKTYFTAKKLLPILTAAVDSMKERLIDDLKRGEKYSTDEGELVLAEKGGKPEIDDLKAFQILRSEFTPDELINAATLSLTALDELVKERARNTVTPDGKKLKIGEEVKRVRERLKSERAIVERKYTMITVKKTGN